MSPEVAQFAPLIVITPLLAAMVWNDRKNLRISNKLVLIMLAAFFFSAPVFLSFHETAYRALFGVGVHGRGHAVCDHKPLDNWISGMPLARIATKSQLSDGCIDSHVGCIIAFGCDGFGIVLSKIVLGLIANKQGLLEY